LLYLDADPQYSEWVGFVTDEGRWVRHGRSLALYGTLTDGRDLHLILAPLFQLSNYLVFELFGPVIEAVGQVALVALVIRGEVDLPLLIIYFSVFIVGGTVPSLMAIGLERTACPRFQRGGDLEGLAHYALLENLGYRQMTALWRLAGLWRALWGVRTWSGKSRRGRAAAAEEQAKAA
jgi:hypothetical protein